MQEGLKPVANPRFLSVFLTEELYVLAEEKLPVPDPALRSIDQKPKEKELKAETKAAEPEPQLSPVPGDLVFGKNGKGILILVDAPGHKVLDKPEGKLLKDILKSVNLEFDDVAILNIARCSEQHYWSCLDSVKYIKLVSFGVQPYQVPVLGKMDKFTALQEEGKTYILAEKLTAITADRAAKIKLWNLLKSHFV
jgi:DNA polymerase III psi subunit